jgi:hypothetical protein
MRSSPLALNDDQITALHLAAKPMLTQTMPRSSKRSTVRLVSSPRTPIGRAPVGSASALPSRPGEFHPSLSQNRT